MKELPLIERARSHSLSIALHTPCHTYTYQMILDRSSNIANELLNKTHDLNERRIAMLIESGYDYVAAQWGIWRAGGIQVPLGLSATPTELKYALENSGAAAVIVDAVRAPKIAPLCDQLSIPFLNLDSIIVSGQQTLPDIDLNRRAMILYTSGTTSQPKGVVTTHANIQSQIESLVLAWDWTSADRIPLFLPLHHIHGIINVTCCGLWSGATIEPFPQFDMAAILDRVRQHAFTVFMAVPTIYVKIVQALESESPENRKAIVEGFAKMRLMVSGSAALPATLHLRWNALTGQCLLERYGMTEIGMALSNPYRGERRPGSVGLPLPGIEVRLISDTGSLITGENEPGEIQVRGPNVFHEYWNRPTITDESFNRDWFKTGDIGIVEQGYYRIMGRKSVDIIKSGGYKLSALEIESVLLEHPSIIECAVVGVQDETWGEAVSAMIVLREAKSLNRNELRTWCRDRMAPYKIPHRLLVVDQLPKNAMGKVIKPEVTRMFNDNIV